MSANDARPWICFYCEFETTDRAEAAAHFGDRDDADEFKPLCKWWDRMSAGERIEEMQSLLRDLNEARDENQRLDALLNTPETEDFFEGIELEAAHQRQRWPSEQDAGKTHADWFWLVGFLAGKCLHSAASGDMHKALHHTISTAAALANWHRAIKGAGNMRPGIATPAEGQA